MYRDLSKCGDTEKIVNQTFDSVGSRESEPKLRCFNSDGGQVNSPVFILAVPRSFSSVISAMIGQHPQMYGLPETELFGARTVAEWWELCSRPGFPTRAHGTLRAVAELCFGGQTERTVKLARGWLLRRSHFTTGFLLETLASIVSPLILVEKSPSNVYKIEFMQRAYRMFPGAKFIHLVRHPRSHGESVVKSIAERGDLGPIKPPHWLLHLASFPDASAATSDDPRRVPELDPQRGWYALNMNIREFLEEVPEDQKMLVRGEELLTTPDRYLPEIAAWMGLRTDTEAIEAMKHPERSPYARFGPPVARFGNDRFFLQNPALRPQQATPQRINGELSWRKDGQGLMPKVKQLAKQFGYE